MLAWIYDVLFLALFAFAAVLSWRKGFLAGLMELIGAVLGVAVAVWASRALAPAVYTQFLSGSVTEKVQAAVAQSGGDLAAAVQALDFLPDGVRTTLTGLLQSAGSALPEQIAAAMQTVLLPFVSDESVPMEVVAANQDKNGSVAIILQCDRMSEVLSEARRIMLPDRTVTSHTFRPFSTLKTTEASPSVLK